MISRAGSSNFFAAHYDWIAAVAGAVALVAGAAFFALSLGDDPDAAAEAERSNLARINPGKTGVKAVDMADYDSAIRQFRSPPTLAEIPTAAASFLASERRVTCKGTPERPCGRAIPGDDKECPFCGAKQEDEEKAPLDADGDGLPDEWEKKYGLNPGDASDANADTDGDGFTNAEEYAAKTDPTDKADHPNYLDSLKTVLPLKETYMPFVFIGARKVSAGWRCDFFDASQKDDYGRQGRLLSAVVSGKPGAKFEEIVDARERTPSGYELVKYERKEKKVDRKGMEGIQVSVDASEATVIRKKDGKQVVLVLAGSKRDKPAPVDVQATLSFSRGQTRTFDVTPGSEFELYGRKYRVESIVRAGDGGKVTVKDLLTDEKRVLGALEQ